LILFEVWRAYFYVLLIGEMINIKEMKKVKLNLLPVIIILILISAISCEKKEENVNPTISFLQPDANLVINNDTIITFIVEPFDADGTIDKVEFAINGTLVHTLVASPWKYDWSISSEESRGAFTIVATVYDNQGAKGEAEIKLEVKSYVTKWVGFYEGTSHHWISYPVEINGQWQYVTNHSYNQVLVEVSQSSQDSCLNLTFTYNQTDVTAKNDLKFLPSGKHWSSWGGGSGYGSLTISFESDSLDCNLFQKCGIPCNSGIDFVIGKQ